uniref:Uncharacterized protein n=1 Tax=Anguilla anguilla TaxID=7936 RepID=A0A0E9QIX0_ANGAN
MPQLIGIQKHPSRRLKVASSTVDE